MFNVDNIASAFLMCWWPYAAIFIRGWFLPEQEDENTGRLLYHTVIGGYLNSLINPLLYIAIKKDVREALKNFILCRDMASFERYWRGI